MQKEWIMLLFLGWNSLCDLGKRKISIFAVCGFGLAGIIWNLIQKENWYMVFAGLLPGLLLMGVSLASRGAVGFGDSLVLAILGFYLGAESAAASLFWGLLCSALFGMGLMLLGRGGRRTELPFVPFLLLGFLGQALLF